MSRITRHVLTLYALLSVLTGVTIWVAGRLPFHSSVDFLHLTDCELPCWIGITPGKTTIREARDQIYNTYGTNTLTEDSQHSSHLTLQSDTARLEIYLNDGEARQDDTVYTIELVIDRNQATYADFQRALGRPAFVAFPGRQGTIYPEMLYPQRNIQIGFSRAVNFNTICSGVSIRQSINGLIIFNRMPSYPNLVQWRGFRPCYMMGPAYDP